MKITIMNRHGDSVQEFDTATAQGLQDAKCVFDTWLLDNGYTAARQTSIGRGEIIREFDPSSDVLLFPRLVGG